MRKSTATAKATPKASREDAKNAKAREDAKEKHCKGKTSKGLDGKDVQSHAPWSRTKSVRSASVVLAPGETGGGDVVNHPITCTHHAVNHPITCTHHAANHPITCTHHAANHPITCTHHAANHPIDSSCQGEKIVRDCLFWSAKSAQTLARLPSLR